MLTKCVTSGILNAAGDLFAQFMFEDAANKGCDWKRAGVFTFLGAALVGPCLHFWYANLNKIVLATGAVGYRGGDGELWRWTSWSSRRRSSRCSSPRCSPSKATRPRWCPS